MRWMGMCCGAALLALPAAAAAQSFVVRTNYYKFGGTNWHEVRRAMVQARPWREDFDAMTHWQVSWRYALTSTDGGCRATSITTTTTIVYTMPWWVGATNATTETIERWRQLYQQLATHEGGHARIAVAGAKEVARQLQQAGTASDCTSLKAQLDAAGNRVIEEHRAKEKEYDRETRHGVARDSADDPRPRSRRR